MQQEQVQTDDMQQCEAVDEVQAFVRELWCDSSDEEDFQAQIKVADARPRGRPKRKRPKRKLRQQKVAKNPQAVMDDEIVPLPVQELCQVPTMFCIGG